MIRQQLQRHHRHERLQILGHVGDDGVGTNVVTVTLSGFTTYRNESVRVAAGSGVPLKATLQVGGVTETVQVNQEAPVVDPARQTVTTGVS